MMNPYDAWAQVYDHLTENVEYEARSAYISGFFLQYGVEPGAQVLDLACGHRQYQPLPSGAGLPGYRGGSVCGYAHHRPKQVPGRRILSGVHDGIFCSGAV